QQFYSQLFDWKVDANNPMDYGMVEAQGGHGIGGGIGSGPQAGACFYVAVADPQAYLDKATSMGAKVVAPVTDMGMVIFAQFADPEGNIVGIIKEEEPHT